MEAVLAFGLALASTFSEVVGGDVESVLAAAGIGTGAALPPPPPPPLREGTKIGEIEL